MSPVGRIHAQINKDLHTEIKVFAAKTDQSITSVIEKALREYLDNHPLKQLGK